jgi:putative PIN family toxin of toxin-antitoxin system
LPEQVIDCCLENHRIILSEELIEEIIAKLKSKAGAPYSWLRFIKLQLFRVCDVIPNQNASVRITRDPKDEHVVAAALKAQCSVIVSGDKDLLILGSYHDIEIIDARTFVDSFIGR